MRTHTYYDEIEVIYGCCKINEYNAKNVLDNYIIYNFVIHKFFMDG